MLLFATILSTIMERASYHIPCFVSYTITKQNEHRINNLEEAFEAQQF